MKEVVWYLVYIIMDVYVLKFIYIIFFFVWFYFLGYIFSKCKLGISLIKILFSIFCFVNIENLILFLFILGLESIWIIFFCFFLWKMKIIEDILNDLKNGWKFSGIVYCWLIEIIRDSWKWCDKCYLKCR